MQRNKSVISYDCNRFTEIDVLNRICILRCDFMAWVLHISMLVAFYFFFTESHAQDLQNSFNENVDNRHIDNAFPNPIFKRYTTSQGLSDNNITCILQDHNNFIWIGTRNGLNQFDGLSFKQFLNSGKPDRLIQSNYITSLMEDRKRRIWIGYRYGGVTVFSPETGEFKQFFHCSSNQDSCSYRAKWMVQVLEDKLGYFWCAMNHEGVCRISPDLSEVEYLTTDDGLLHNHVRALHEDLEGKVWVGTQTGVSIFDPHTRKFESLTHDAKDVNSLSSKYVWTIEQDYQENIWIGTAGVSPSSKTLNPNLNLYVPAIKGFKHFKISGDDIKIANQSKRIFEISPLPNGDLWLAGHGAGVTYYSKKTNQFKSWIHDSEDDNSVGFGDVNGLLTDCTDGLWVGSTRGGLSYYHPGFESFKSITNKQEIKLPFGKATRVQEDVYQRLWVGTEEGLYVQLESGWKQILSEWIRGEMLIAQDDKIYVWSWPNTAQFIEIDINTFETKVIKKVNYGGPIAVHMCEDNRGNLFMFNGYNLVLFNINTHHSQLVDDLNNIKSKSSSRTTPVFLGADIDKKNGILWYMDAELGLVKGKIQYADTNISIKILETFSLEEKYHHPSRDPQPQNVFYDEVLNVVWLTSQNGLFKVNEQTGEFDLFNQEDGLIDENLSDIKKDDDGDLIIMHLNNYVSVFNIDSQKFSHRSVIMPEDISDAVPGTAIRRADGSFVAARQNSLIAFNPSKWSSYPQNQPIYITGFSLFNDHSFNSLKGLDESIKYEKEIDLKHNQNFWTIDYTVVDFVEPTAYQFAYRLKGLESEFNFVGNKREAVYTNIDPGTYTFQLRATKNHTSWEDAEYTELGIVIAPPWWATWWAYVFYGCVTVFLAFYLYRFLLKRQHEKHESLRLQQLDELKTKLYTNVTHEFRSPLTVILGMADKIGDYFDQHEENKFDEGRRLIRRSGMRLLNLVNQMLDLSKIDAGYNAVLVSQQNIIQYINYIVESFHSLAGDKSIELIVEHDLDEQFMDFDENVIQKILSNLLANAIHFSFPNGEIYIRTKIKQPHFEIEVQDFGQGISEDHLPRVFDRFYQVDKISRAGTGVGLALAKELTLQLEGRIWVESVVGKGSTFFVSLPVSNNAAFKDQILETNVPLATPLAIELASGNKNMPLVLVIEDIREVAFYIGKCLEAKYQLEYAEDGQAGIEKAIQLIPDFIISDVMMPKKSGFEVTDILKKDQRTSHIPIVLLTAKASDDSKIQGLKKGADAYLTKPFNKDELLVRIEYLIELRRQLRKKYANMEIEPANDQSNDFQQEDVFISELREFILNESSDDLNVNDICLKVGMSRSQLHRKLTALTNQSTTQFVRSVRFRKAKELLKSTQLSIAEIAYETGFKTPSYFSRMFSKEEGLSPTDYREKHKS